MSLQGLEQETVVLVPCRLPYKKIVLGNLCNGLALVLAGALSRQGEEVLLVLGAEDDATLLCTPQLAMGSLTVTVGEKPKNPAQL